MVAPLVMLQRFLRP